MKPSEIHIEIKLKSNAIFGVNRKYNFPSITIQFLRPPKYIESFDEIDFTFGAICDAGKPKKNIIRKLGTFFYHLHSNDNYLRKLEETHLPVNILRFFFTIFTVKIKLIDYFLINVFHENNINFINTSSHLAKMLKTELILHIVNHQRKSMHIMLYLTRHRHGYSQKN